MVISLWVPEAYQVLLDRKVLQERPVLKAAQEAQEALEGRAREGGLVLQAQQVLKAAQEAQEAQAVRARKG